MSGAADFYTGTIGTVYATAIAGQRFVEDDVFTKIVEQAAGVTLELGCGTGRLMTRLLAAGHEVHGLDISDDMITRCRDEARRLGVDPVIMHGSFAPLRADLTGYAAVICPLNAFSFILDDELALASLRSFVRACVPGGVVAIAGAAGEPDLGARDSWVRRDDVLIDGGLTAEVHERRVTIADGTVLQVDRRVQLKDDDGHRHEVAEAQQLRRLRGRGELADLFDRAGLRGLHAYGDDADYILTGRT